MNEFDFALKNILLQFSAKKNITQESYLLEALHKIQEHFSFIPKQSISFIAEYFNLSKAEVYGVISFYDDFVLEENGTETKKTNLYLCQAEACQSMGSRQLATQIKEQMQDKFTLKTVYCLGNCALAPSVLIQGQCLGRINIDKLKQYSKNLDQ